MRTLYIVMQWCFLQLFCHSAHFFVYPMGQRRWCFTDAGSSLSGGRWVLSDSLRVSSYLVEESRVRVNSKSGSAWCHYDGVFASDR